MIGRDNIVIRRDNRGHIRSIKRRSQLYSWYNNIKFWKKYYDNKKWYNTSPTPKVLVIYGFGSTHDSIQTTSARWKLLLFPFFFFLKKKQWCIDDEHEKGRQRSGRGGLMIFVLNSGVLREKLSREIVVGDGWGIVRIEVVAMEA